MNERKLGTYSLDILRFGRKAVVAKVTAGGIKVYFKRFYLGKGIDWEQVTPLQDVDALDMLQRISPQLKEIVASNL
jgi:hypothetical protein